MPPLRGKRQTYASPKRQSKIQRELISKGLPIEFAGRNVDQWKLGELKKLISIFDKDVSTKGLKEQALCITLHHSAEDQGRNPDCGRGSHDLRRDQQEQSKDS